MGFNSAFKGLIPSWEADIFSYSQESLQILSTGARIRYCVHPANSAYLELYFKYTKRYISPVPVAGRSKAWVCGRSLAGIVGSNPASSMDVCYECCELSGRGLCVGLISRAEESYSVWCVQLSLIMNPRQWGGLGPLGVLSYGKKKGKFHPSTGHEAQRASKVITVPMVRTLCRFFFGRDIQVSARHLSTCPGPLQQTMPYPT